jgi:hypothetical protein
MDNIQGTSQEATELVQDLWSKFDDLDTVKLILLDAVQYCDDLATGKALDEF